MESSPVTSWNTSSVRSFTVSVFTNAEYGRARVGSWVGETVTVTPEAVEMLLVYRWMYTQERSVLVAGNCLTSDPQIRKLNRCAAAIVRAQQVCGKHARVISAGPHVTVLAL